MAKKIKYKGYNVAERASSGGSIPGITGSESVQRNYFLHQLYAWQDREYTGGLIDLELMFSDFPGEDGRIKANVAVKEGTSPFLKFPIRNEYIKCINYTPPKATLRKTYTSGDGYLPTDRDYMRYIVVGGGGGGGKGTSPRLGTGTGGAGGGGGGMIFGEAMIGGYKYQVGKGGSGATADGNRGVTGGESSIYSVRKAYARGGEGGGNETLYGSGGTTGISLYDTIHEKEMRGADGGRNRAAGSNRPVPDFNDVREIIGLGDLIDGGSGYGWSNLLKSSSYFGTSAASGGAADNVNGGGGGGGASLGRGGRIVRSSGAQTSPLRGGGGAGAPGKGNNGQDGGNGVIYIFW